MLTSPSECFRKYVFPPWEQFLSQPRDEWRALCAARAANAHLEWVFEYYKRGRDQVRIGNAGEVHEFRRQLLSRCAEIEIVKDVADAAGHRFLDRGPQRLVRASTDALIDDAGELRFSADGRPFIEILRAVVEFWRVWLD